MTDPSKIPNITLPREDEEWLTAFTEGDGWLTYDSTNSKFMIGYEQKDKQVLESIRTLLGSWSQGSLFPVSWGGWRLQYSARYFVYGLIILLSRHIVTDAWADKLGIQKHEPTLPWIVGFWDAEGHPGITKGAGMHKNLFIGISQKDRRVLDDIRSVLGIGSIHPLQVIGRETRIWDTTFTPTEEAYGLFITTQTDSSLINALLQYSHHLPKKQKLLTDIKTVNEWPDVLKAIKAIAAQRRQSAKEGGDANDISV